MRLFVAAEPSEPVRTAASACAARLSRRLEAAGSTRGFRWVPAENLHLTVWFLGEVSDARALPVLEALRPPLDSPAFTLHLAGLGAFPPTGVPRVVWLGVTAGERELALAHDEVGSRLAPWGFPAEGRAYSAHLTIARIKTPPPPAVRAALRATFRDDPADAGSCRIDALTVFRSRTSPAGATYEPLLRVPLT